MKKIILITAGIILGYIFIPHSVSAQTCTDTKTGDIVCHNYIGEEVNRIHCETRLGLARNPLTMECVVDCPPPPPPPPPVNNTCEPTLVSCRSGQGTVCNGRYDGNLPVGQTTTVNVSGRHHSNPSHNATGTAVLRCNAPGVLLTEVSCSCASGRTTTPTPRPAPSCTYAQVYCVTTIYQNKNEADACPSIGSSHIENACSSVRKESTSSGTISSKIPHMGGCNVMYACPSRWKCTRKSCPNVSTPQHRDGWGLGDNW